LDIYKHTDGDVGDIVNASGWFWPEGSLRYPELVHVQGDTYVCTCIAANRSDPNDVSVLITVTYDGGVTWSNLYYESGDDLVIEEYRGIETPVGSMTTPGGKVTVWEYLYDTGDPTDLVIFLHYSYLTVELTGAVTDEYGVAVNDPIVDIFNLDPEYGFQVDAGDITIDGNEFMTMLLLGFDIWTNTTFRVYAEDQTGYLTGETEHVFEEINQVNVMDVVLYPSPPALITAARSIITHGSVGDLAIDLVTGNPLAIEPRLLGITKVQFDLDKEVSTVDASVTPCTGTYTGTVTVEYVDADTINVVFSEALPNMVMCTITLTGDADDSFEVRPLAGDMDMGGLVSTGDASIIKPKFGDTPGVDCDPEFDFDCSGLVSTSDFSQVKPKFGDTMIC
jgi:hypothetical protein